MKKTITTLALFLLIATFAFAQKQRPRQMQKLQTQIMVEFADFVDVNKNARLSGSVKLDDLINYTRSGVDQKTIRDYAFSQLIINDARPYKFINGVTVISTEKESDFSKDRFYGTDVEIRYLSSTNETAAISLKINGETRIIQLAKSAANVFPAEWLNAADKASNRYIAARLVKSEKQTAACSIGDITNDIINQNDKSWKRICFEAGSPQLK